MKTMNFLVLLTMVFSLNSCLVEENQANETFNNSQRAQFGNEETQPYLEPSLHLYFLEREHEDLSAEKLKLIEAIENGDEEAVEQLEQVQEKLELNQSYQEFLHERYGDLMVRFPPRPPRNPCKIGKRTHCPVPGIRLMNILNPQDASDLLIQVKTADGEIIDEITDFDQDEQFEGMNSYRFELNEELSQLTFTKEFAAAGGEISYTIFVQL